MKEFKVRLRKRNISEEELLLDLKSVATKLSKKTLTTIEYTANGSFGVNTYLRKFEKWNIALEKAGLEAPNRQDIPEPELFENIANVWTSIGRQPSGREMDKTHGVSQISVGTYERRFGSWNQALLAFENYIKLGRIAETPLTVKSVFLKEKRTSRKINWRLRAQVLIRDNCICQMCGASPPNVTLHADHIMPWSKGGETTLDNLRTLCSRCNIGKSDLYDEE